MKEHGIEGGRAVGVCVVCGGTRHCRLGSLTRPQDILAHGRVRASCSRLWRLEELLEECWGLGSIVYVDEQRLMPCEMSDPSDAFDGAEVLVAETHVSIAERR